MRKNTRRLVVAALLKAGLLICPAAWGTTIEGFTDAGDFQTVGVTADGRFKIDISSQARIHVVVDSGSQLFVTASSATTQVTGVTTLTAGTTAEIYPADAQRTQGIVCNDDLTGLQVFYGAPNTSTTTYKLMVPGCLGPDGPQSFTGRIVGVSTATVRTSYWYAKRP